MKPYSGTILALTLSVLSVLSALAAPTLKIATRYPGTCDGSAGVALSTNWFVGANDEDNQLRIYRTDAPQMPVREIDLDAFLDLSGKSAEVDLEGAARIGDRIFWIGSHSDARTRKPSPNRQRLFATDITWKAGEPVLTPVGKPCKSLLQAMIDHAPFSRYQFAAAAAIQPKEFGAIDIEGLTATPEGALLIAFRSPLPDRHALLIPLMNPNQVIQGETPAFGPAIQMDLHGLGIRDIAFHDGRYLIIAGSVDGSGVFRLYSWVGPAATPRLLDISFPKSAGPEAIVVYPHLGWSKVQILSDDGNLETDGKSCKSQKDPRRKSFGSFWLLE